MQVLVQPDSTCTFTGRVRWFTPDTQTTERGVVPRPPAPQNTHTHTSACLLNHAAAKCESSALMSATLCGGPLSENPAKPRRRHHCHFIWTFLLLSYSWLKSPHKAPPERALHRGCALSMRCLTLGELFA